MRKVNEAHFPAELPPLKSINFKPATQFRSSFTENMELLMEIYESPNTRPILVKKEEPRRNSLEQCINKLDRKIDSLMKQKQEERLRDLAGQLNTQKQNIRFMEKILQMNIKNNVQSPPSGGYTIPFIVNSLYPQVPQPQYSPYSRPPYPPQPTDPSYSKSQYTPYPLQQKQVQFKLKQTRLSRIFRRAVWVVYFSLFFPRYSKKFTQMRYLKQESIRSNPQQFLREIEQSVISTVGSLDIYTQLLAQNEEPPKQESDSDSESGSESNSEKEEEEEKNEGVNLNKVGVLSLLLIIKLAKMVQQGQFNEQIGLLSKLYLNNSFSIDGLFLIQQLYHLKLNKTMIQVTKKESKLLVVTHLLIKVITFKFLMVGDKHSKWKQQIIKIIEVQGQEKQINFQLQIMTQELYLIGFLIYEHTMQLIEQSSPGVGNIEKISKGATPLQMKPMSFTEEEPDVKVQEFEFIENLVDQTGSIEKLLKGFKEGAALKKAIMKLSEAIYAQMAKGRKKQYSQLREDVLKQKFLLKNEKAEKQYGFQRNKQGWEKIKELNKKLKGK